MKKSNLIIPVAALGLGAFLYSYTKKHPIKTQIAMTQAKMKMDEMMKDFK